jgi:SAM-dependent methyltransferase
MPRRRKGDEEAMKSPSELHQEMVAYWTGVGGAAWIERSDKTETMLAPVAARLMTAVKVKAGETVLDVGCGLGPTSRDLAELVGPAGRVVGLDISGPMIAEARRRGAGIANLEFMVGDAATHRFAAPFADVLFSRFGVMFFGDPTAAFSNLKTALKPSGRVVFACWRRMSENPWMLKPLLAAYQHVPKLPEAGPEEPGPFAFADPDRLRRIMTGAGFAAPRLTPLDLDVDIAGGAGLDAAVKQAMIIGATSRVLQDQPDGLRAKVAEAIHNALAPHAKGGKVELAAAVWLVETEIA